MGLLIMFKLHIFQLFLCLFTLKHKNIEAENLHGFPPQLLTFSQNLLYIIFATFRLHKYIIHEV